MKRAILLLLVLVTCLFSKTKKPEITQFKLVRLHDCGMIEGAYKFVEGDNILKTKARLNNLFLAAGCPLILDELHIDQPEWLTDWKPNADPIK